MSFSTLLYNKVVITAQELTNRAFYYNLTGQDTTVTINLNSPIANLNLPEDINAYAYSSQPTRYITDEFIGIIINIGALQ